MIRLECDHVIAVLEHRTFIHSPIVAPTLPSRWFGYIRHDFFDRIPGSATALLQIDCGIAAVHPLFVIALPHEPAVLAMLLPQVVVLCT